MIAKLNDNDLDLTSVILQKLRLRKNNYVFNQQFLHPTTIIIEAKKEVEEFVQA